jgi:hypothetical protein
MGTPATDPRDLAAFVEEATPGPNRQDCRVAYEALRQISGSGPEQRQDVAHALRTYASMAMTAPLYGSHVEQMADLLHAWGAISSADDLSYVLAKTISPEVSCLADAEPGSAWFPQALLTWFSGSAAQRVGITGTTRWYCHPRVPIPLQQRLVLAPTAFRSGMAWDDDIRHPVIGDSLAEVIAGMDVWARPWKFAGARLPQILELGARDIAGCAAWLFSLRPNPFEGWHMAADMLGIQARRGWMLATLDAIRSAGEIQQAPAWSELWPAACLESDPRAARRLPTMEFVPMPRPLLDRYVSQNGI